MIILNTKEKRVCVVEVPEGATEFLLTIEYILCCKDGRRLQDIKLPSGSWKILGLLDSITEEQARDILDPYGIYAVYTDYSNSDNAIFSKALESFHSLLRSHNLDTTKNLLIMGEEG